MNIILDGAIIAKVKFMFVSYKETQDIFLGRI